MLAEFAHGARKFRTAAFSHDATHYHRERQGETKRDRERQRETEGDREGE